MVDRARWAPFYVFYVALAIATAGMTAHCGNDAANPCGMMVSPSASRCPDLVSVAVSPSQTDVGGSVAVGATVTGAVDAGTVTFSWSAPSGSFADRSSPVTTFTCTAPGIVTVTVKATQEGCSEMMTASVDCVVAADGAAD